MCGPPAPAQNCSGNCRTRHQSRRRHAWKRKLDDLQEGTRASPRSNNLQPKPLGAKYGAGTKSGCRHVRQSQARSRDVKAEQNQGAAVCGSPKPTPGMSKSNASEATGQTQNCSRARTGTPWRASPCARERRWPAPGMFEELQTRYGKMSDGHIARRKTLKCQRAGRVRL